MESRQGAAAGALSAADVQHWWWCSAHAHRPCPCRHPPGTATGSAVLTKETREFAFVVTDIEGSTEASNQDQEAFKSVSGRSGYQPGRGRGHSTLIITVKETHQNPAPPCLRPPRRCKRRTTRSCGRRLPSTTATRSLQRATPFRSRLPGGAPAWQPACAPPATPSCHPGTQAPRPQHAAWLLLPAPLPPPAPPFAAHPCCSVASALSFCTDAQFKLLDTNWPKTVHRLHSCRLERSECPCRRAAGGGGWGGSGGCGRWPQQGSLAACQWFYSATSSPPPHGCTTLFTLHERQHHQTWGMRIPTPAAPPPPSNLQLQRACPCTRGHACAWACTGRARGRSCTACTC